MSSADPHTYRPLDGGWRVAEDSHGRTYFINEAKGTTSWYDPRHDVKYLKKFDNKGPNVVRIGFALHELQQNNGFSQVNEAKLQSVLEKKEGSKSEANLKRDGLRALVQEAVDKNDPSVANKITDRLMSLFDVKHEGVVEYRIATLGLIFLSTMKTYRKFQLAFLVLDTTRSNRLDQSSLFAMFKTITKLIENPYYRYKLAISNRNLISDVVSCLQTVKITKGRANDGTITFPEFVSYAIDDPLILRPLSMLEKIQVSRNTAHSGKKCGSCQKAITGIRYKSQDSFNMCEDCFWKGIETAQFKKKDAFYEYPTEHTAQEKASEKVSGHYVPTMMRSGRARDDEALRPEQIDPAGNFLDPTSASRSGSTTNF